ncbi:MAG: hypothetical protein ACI80K_002313 [Paracoccaceae bacterium]|jgi:hypothetical protein
MTSEAKRPNPIQPLLVLLAVILVGAYISLVPLVMVKMGGAALLVLVYGFFAASIVDSMGIASTSVRKMVGLVLGVATVYLTWVIRLPVFAGWDVALTFDPALILEGVKERASAMQLSSGFGHGTTTEGPSWLLLGTYIGEAFAFVGAMFLAAWLSGPDEKGDEEQEQGELAGSPLEGLTSEQA